MLKRTKALLTAGGLVAATLLATPAVSADTAVGVESDALGNVFTSAPAVQFTVDAPEPAQWRVIDDQGAVVATGNAQAGGSVIQPHITDDGYYTLDVKTSADDIFSTSFSLIPAWEGPKDERFGMNTAFGLPVKGAAPVWDPETKTFIGGTPVESTDVVPILDQTGAAGIRDTLGWNQFEPEEGLYVGGPSYYDAYIDAAVDIDAEPLVILSYGNKLYDQDDEGFGAAPFTERGIQAYAEYARAVLERHEGKVSTVEVWNEYNGAGAPWNRGPCAADARCYYEMLKATAEVVKETHPEARIVGPAGVTIPYKWIEELFSYGALEYLDAVTVHPYGYPNAPETGYTAPSLPGVGLDARIAQLDELVREYNDGQSKPIWFTEVGWQSNRSARGVSEAVQADYLVRSQVIALASGVERIYWFSLENSGTNPEAAGQNWGMLRNSDDPAGAYTPKPAFNGYATLTRQLSGAEFDTRDETPSGIRSYAFEHEDGQSVRAMWSTSGLTDVTLAADGPLVVTRQDGQQRTLEPFDGEIMLTLSGSPLYVTGEIGGITASSMISASAPASVSADGDLDVTVTVDATDATRAIPAFATIEGDRVKVFTPPRQTRSGQSTVDAGRGIVTNALAARPEERTRTVLVDVTISSKSAAWLEVQSRVD